MTCPECGAASPAGRLCRTCREAADQVASPCLRECRLVGDTCAGCLRTLGEIARWGRASRTERLAIV
ncbi:MAG: DUF1289 domain-containing protein, partial [Chloroflexota bacterium]